MDKSMKMERIELGVCYYPEHWPKELWAQDLDRMKDAGIGTIRIAEFAWNLTEPKDGVFVYDFWDEFLELALEKEMKVIFCTPTATPPAWLTEKHPEVLNCDESGVPYHHGSRRHYNYNSTVYRFYVSRIVTVLAEHYGKHPAIIGWQLDNEFNCEENQFYSEADDAAFRRFVKAKYGTLDALNEAWGTRFWNQTYSDWSEVHIARHLVSKGFNPHQRLDYFRFISDSTRQFAKLQSDILRKYVGEDVFITTNGLFGNLDNHEMTQESLDFMMYDSYPNFAFDLYSDPLHSDSLNDRKWSRNLTEVRSISPIFGIMEQQSGANGWAGRMEAPAPKPGQLKLWTMQSIANGADYVSYFRWRTSIMGTEIYWHGILDYDNRDNRKLAEVKQVNELLKAIGDAAGSRYQAAFAVVKDYDNVWDAQVDAWHRRLEEESQKGLFKAAQLTHTPMDYLYIGENTVPEDLEKYPVLIYPHPAIISEKTAKLLTSYVKAGGKLVLGCRAGYKDPTGKCVMMPAPGLLAKLAGGTVSEFTMVGPADEPNEIIVSDQQPRKVTSMENGIFVDILQGTSRQTTIMGRYINDFYKGRPAMLKHPVGDGCVYTLGTTFTEKNARELLSLLGIIAPYEDIIRLPESCELTVRKKGEESWYFILNYMKTPAKVTVKKPLTDPVSLAIVNGTVTIPAYGVLVLKG